MPAPTTPQRAVLGRRLRELRAAAFPSGSALARYLGWHQTRVSKLEQGVQHPTEDDLHRWAAAVGATTEQSAELFDLASAARVEYATFRQRYRHYGGPIAEQASTTRRDAASGRIAEFQPAMVPGLLQTAAYAREVLAQPCGPTAAGACPQDIEQIVATRLERQQVLYEGQHSIQLVLGEAALHTRFGATETLLGQLDRLLVLADYPHIQLGVVPFTEPLPVYPLTNFVLYDDHVLIESLTAQHRLDDPTELATYANYLDQLFHAAVTGSELHALLLRVVASLRSEYS